MKLIDCGPEYCEAIRAIFNDAIVKSTAVYDYKPRTPEMIGEWFAGKQRDGFPVIGLITDEGELMGFGSYGRFRPFPAYKYTIEHSIYVAEGFRRQGLGKRLLEELVIRAKAQQFHTLIGVIDSQNTASIRMHEKYGFRNVATIPQVGFKFGRWLDLCLMQRVLDTPSEPVDG